MLRVLMVGPQLDQPGGIATLSRRLLDGAPADVAMTHLPTTSTGSGPRKILAAARASKRLVEAVRRDRPDVAHVHVGGGASLLRKAGLVAELRALGVPVVLHTHFAGSVAGGPHQAALRALCAAASVVVALSPQQAASLPAGAEVVVVPNGVPTDRFVPLGPAGGPPTALYLGGDDPRKGWEDLISAVPSLPSTPWRLRLAGPGAERLRAHLPASDRVEYLGSLGPDALVAALQDADVLLLPSRAEGLPLALLEAMSCGLACIATRCDGMVDAVEDGVSGLLIPPRDPRALAAAWARLNADPALRQRLGAAARAAILDRFDQAELIAQLGRIWRRSAGQPAAPA